MRKKTKGTLKMMIHMNHSEAVVKKFPDYSGFFHLSIAKSAVEKLKNNRLNEEIEITSIFDDNSNLRTILILY